MFHRGFEWKRGDMQKQIAGRVTSSGVRIPQRAFPSEGVRIVNMWKRGVSGDVYSEVSVGKADLKPCPIECCLVKVGGEGAVSFV